MGSDRYATDGDVFVSDASRPREYWVRESYASLREVPGFFDFADIYSFISQGLSDDSTFVEVGAFAGKSVVFMAKAAEVLGAKFKIYAVDTFQGEPLTEVYEGEHPIREVYESWKNEGVLVRDVFYRVLDSFGVRDRIQVLEMTSKEAAQTFEDESVDCVFIDGDHTYPAVVEDIKAWLPKIRPAGLLAGHDIDYVGVVKAVSELLPGFSTLSWRSWAYSKRSGNGQGSLGHSTGEGSGGPPSGDSDQG